MESVSNELQQDSLCITAVSCEKERSPVHAIYSRSRSDPPSGYRTVRFQDLTARDLISLPNTRVSAMEDSKGDSPPSSIERLPLQEENSFPMIRLNVGSMDSVTTSTGLDFSGDDFFTGGDTIRTEAVIRDEECNPLYQSARFGTFSYHFPSLEPGSYLVDLHLAEIVFTNGPSGMRVFDVYIQEKKVVSGIDIYACVGGNKPLRISDLKAFVNGGEGLSIKFGGGNPIVCGITVRKGHLSSFGEDGPIQFWAKPQYELLNGVSNLKFSKPEILKPLKQDYDFENMELAETKQALMELTREHEMKTRECTEAWKSLKDLQNELMRKSMHVGTLAIAVEGQVTEKTRWALSLREVERTLKIIKMDQVNLQEVALEYKSFATQINQINNIIQSKMKQQADGYESLLRMKVMDGAKERKELYNKVLELQGNIRVFCRCRPLSLEEINSGATMAVDFEGAKDGELTVKSNGSTKKVFKFDAVFSPQADQVDVFEDAAPFATSVLDGYNVCIFAYGQTGTGKTFTMEGTDEARGVNFRTLEELFRNIKMRENIVQYDMSVSVLEVYNEQIRDLLVSKSQPGVASKKRLEIRQVGEGIHSVPGLVEASVKNMDEVWEVLHIGSSARVVGSTNANEHSSRSHCIHCVMVKGENLVTGECTASKLWLVDLAGSERVARTDVQGERLKETQHINKSLSALGDVISALASKSPHIPYRNSKLTHLLQDSLGGDSKTLMFVQISPNENDLSETLCSLNFASRARGVELGHARKQADSSELLRYKQLFEKGKQDIKGKDLQIKKMEETLHCLDLKLKEKDLKNKSLQEKVKEFEELMHCLDAKMKEKDLKNKSLQEKVKDLEESLHSTEGKAKEKDIKIKNLQEKARDLEERIHSLDKMKERDLKNNNLQEKVKDLEESMHSIDIKKKNLQEKANDLEERIHSLVENIKEKDHNNKALQDKVNELEAQVSTAQARNIITELPNGNAIFTRPLTENNIGLKSPPVDFLKNNDPAEKENNDPARKENNGEQVMLRPWSGTSKRSTYCPGSSQIQFPAAIVPRCDSWNPLLHSPISEQSRSNGIDKTDTICPETCPISVVKQTQMCSSTKGVGKTVKKVGSMVRRSLNKKINLPYGRMIVGTNVGREKLRVSIGSRGKMGHRVLVGNARRTELQQKQKSHRVKERGWNVGTGRAVA